MPTAESISLCPICGNHVHQAHCGRARKFCSEKCKDLAGSRAQDERLRIAADEARPMVPCIVCGTKFKQKYRRMYCSDKCREKAKRERPQRKEYIAKYFEKNREHDRARAREYMRNRLAGDSDFKTRHLRSSGRRRDTVIARDDNTANWFDLFSERKTCPYCGTQITREIAVIDHMDPIKLGGCHGKHNLTICCRDCNSRKSGKHYSDWLAMLPEARRNAARRWYIRKHGKPPEDPQTAFTFAFNP